MNEYKFVSPSQTCAKAFMLPPLHFDSEPFEISTTNFTTGMG